MTDAERKAAPPLEDVPSLVGVYKPPLTVQENALTSIAISLKRIADSMETMRISVGARSRGFDDLKDSIKKSERRDFVSGGKSL